MCQKKNRADRLKFANEHKDWTVDDWSRVVWSDETKVNLTGSDGREYVRRRANEEFDPKCTKKTKKFGGGSVMV